MGLSKSKMATKQYKVVTANPVHEPETDKNNLNQFYEKDNSSFLKNMRQLDENNIFKLTQKDNYHKNYIKNIIDYDKNTHFYNYRDYYSLIQKLKDEQEKKKETEKETEEVYKYRDTVIYDSPNHNLENIAFLNSLFRDNWLFVKCVRLGSSNILVISLKRKIT